MKEEKSLPLDVVLGRCIDKIAVKAKTFKSLTIFDGTLLNLVYQESLKEVYQNSLNAHNTANPKYVGA